MEFLSSFSIFLFFLDPLNNVKKSRRRCLSRCCTFNLLRHKTATCTRDIISNVTAVNTINRRDVFVCTYYRTREIFGGGKYWRIWRIRGNSPNFYPPNVLVDKIRKSLKFYPPNILRLSVFFVDYKHGRNTEVFSLT